MSQHKLYDYVFLCAFVAIPFVWPAYQFLFRMRVWITPLLALGIILAHGTYLIVTNAAAVTGINENNAIHGDGKLFLSVLAFYLAGALLVGLCIKVYLAFIGKARPEEMAPGAASLRSWIRPFHATLVVIMALAARLSLDWSIFSGLLAGTALLLMYPLITALTRSNPVPAETVNESEERERVLKLVEDGKITADDAAELISALGQSRTRVDRTPIAAGPMRPIIWVGAGLVALSFVMPWFEINVADELRRVMSNSIGNLPPGAAFPGFPIEGAPNTMINGAANLSLKVSGADLHYGIGWIILLTALAIAVLPLLWPHTPMNRQSHRGITIALALAGSLLLFYAVGSGLHSVTIGAVVAIAGYTALWIGIAREFSLGRTRQPALA